MSRGGISTRTPASTGRTRTNTSITRSDESPWTRGFIWLLVGLPIIVDSAMVMLALVLANRWSPIIRLDAMPFGGSRLDALPVLFIATSLTIAIFGLGGHYRAARRFSRIDEFYLVCRHVSLSLVLALTANTLLLGSTAAFSRRLLFLSWLLTILLVTLGRVVIGAVFSQLRVHGQAIERLLIVGTGRNARIVHRKIERTPALSYRVIGFVAHPRPGEPVPQTLAGTPVLGSTTRLVEVVRRYEINELILAIEQAPPEEILDLVHQVIRLPVAIKVYPDTFRLVTDDELSIQDLGGLPVMTVRAAGLKVWSRAVKRATDGVVSSLVLLVLSPLMAVLALLIRLDSPGPILYRQERIGQDGIPFDVLKFRSMRVDAEAATGPVFAAWDDPRTTRIGRFMRRYSLDELPQFINVLRGQMSVVGPRPERPYFVEQFSRTIPYYMARHSEKVGITGWAQVNGLRGRTSVEERTRYDLYYVANWSLLFDIKIMVKTLKVIFREPNFPDHELPPFDDRGLMSAASIDARNGSYSESRASD